MSELSNHRITFEYAGKTYSVPPEAPSLNCPIILPNGQALEPDFWGESLPPAPVGLHTVTHNHTTLSPEEIATRMRGVLAIEERM